MTTKKKATASTRKQTTTTTKKKAAAPKPAQKHTCKCGNPACSNAKPADAKIVTLALGAHWIEPATGFEFTLTERGFAQIVSEIDKAVDAWKAVKPTQPRQAKEVAAFLDKIVGLRMHICYDVAPPTDPQPRRPVTDKEDSWPAIVSAIVQAIKAQHYRR